jgi:CubicO group peptidase (beta-lactamase class C family)/photosystem II stability/assembly factor-like uncharacterized protein
MLLVISLGCRTIVIAPTATSLSPTFAQPLPTRIVPTLALQSRAVPPTTNPGSSKLLEGGSIYILLIDPKTPTTIYAVTNTGVVFKSINGGENWNSAKNGLSDFYVGALAIDPAAPSTIYATTNDNGIFKSTNGGEDWSAINTGLRTNEFSKLAIDPRTPTILYVNTREGVFKSTNGGENWMSSNNGLANLSVNALAIDPITPATLYAGTNSGVFKSSDSGENWTKAGTSLTGTIHTLVIVPTTPNIIYAGTNDGVFKTTNGGENWVATTTGSTNTDIYALAIDSTMPSTLYLSTKETGIFKSVNGGEVWSSANVGQINTPILVMAIDPLTPTTLYVGTWGWGVFKSIDGGDNWKATNAGLAGSAVSALVFDKTAPAIRYAGTWGGGVFKSMNSGETWSAINTGLTNCLVLALVIDPLTTTNLYAGTDGDGMFKSTNGGANWIEINTGLTNSSVNSLVIDPVKPTNVYAGTIRGVFKSTNGGGNWVAINSGLTETDVYALAIDSVTPATLYAATYHGGIFKSTNGGQNWSAVNNGLTDTHAFALAISPATPTIIYVGTANGSLFKSTNSGKKWDVVNIGLPGYPKIYALLIDPETASTLYAITDEYAFKSTDSGVTWNILNIGQSNNRATVMAIDPMEPTTLRVGTWDGNLLAIQSSAVINSTSIPSPTVSPPLATLDWQEIMDAFAQDSLNNTPLVGMTLAIRRQGEPDWIRAYGFADLEGDIPASPETVYQIGSLSMQFTAAAVMQLSERGQLDINAPISQYLEGLPEALQAFTLRQLLTHTSRIYDSPFDLQDQFLSQQDFTSETLLQELVPNLNVSSNEIPEMFSYGNFILAGLIVEKASGLSYSNYLNQYVFAPAGLQHTSYCLPMPAGLAHNYYLQDNGFEPLQINVSAVFAAGGLCSTTHDLLDWMDALTSGKVISPESYRKMITPTQFPDGSLGSFGFGMYVLPDPKGLQIGFLGAEVSNASYLISYPDKGLTIVMLSNTVKPDNNLFEMVQSKIPFLVP